MQPVPMLTSAIGEEPLRRSPPETSTDLGMRKSGLRRKGVDPPGTGITHWNWNNVFEFAWRILVFVVAISILLIVSCNFTRWEGAATAQIGVATADLYPTVRAGGVLRRCSFPGLRPRNQCSEALACRTRAPAGDWLKNVQLIVGPTPQVSPAAAALASFDSVVLGALKEAEQSLTVYDVENLNSLLEAREEIHAAFEIARHEAAAGALSNLDLLTTE